MTALQRPSRALGGGAALDDHGPCAEATALVAATARDGGDLAGFDQITLVGLVLEAASGLQRAVAPTLDRQFDLAGQDFEILLRLARTPGARLRMSDLAAQTSLTPSGLTRAIDRLGQSGLVRRESCAEDRRGSFAALTEAGEARMRQALAVHRAELAEVLAGLYRPEEAAALTELLRRLRDRVHPGAGRVPA